MKNKLIELGIIDKNNNFLKDSFYYNDYIKLENISDSYTGDLGNYLQKYVQIFKLKEYRTKIIELKLFE